MGRTGNRKELPRKAKPYLCLLYHFPNCNKVLEILLIKKKMPLSTR